MPFKIIALSLITLVAGAAISFMATTPKNPLQGQALYVNIHSQISKWVQDHPEDPRANLFSQMSSQPQAIWLNGSAEDVQNLKQALAESESTDTMPTFVLYNIPNRDCGSYSAGGAANDAAYTTWSDSIIDELDGNKAIVIVEPDALASLECLNPQERASRLTLINKTVEGLSKIKNVFVYIDAGHPVWQTPSTMAERLTKAGIEHAQGFSLNISNFFRTEEVADYGRQIAHLFLNKKTFVIDTSRNGNGPTDNNEWCNPKGRILGATPTTTPNMAYVDAFLWIKIPGESDGACNGGPKAGLFWPEYAESLIKNPKVQY